MRSFKRGKGRFVKKTDFSISGKRGRKGISRSTSKFKERIRGRTSRDEKRRRSSFMPGLMRARKSRLESERRLNAFFIKRFYVEKRYINGFKKFRRVVR